MPLQNRVDPFGELHAVPDRGLFMGNRGGCFHRDDQTLKPTRWASRQWIVCLLEFKDRKRPLMQPGLYTELFFLDEATAFAAGHRPCYECRRGDATAFRDALMRRGAFDAPPLVGALNDAIAGEIQDRLRSLQAPRKILASTLPDGAMFALDGRAWLKAGDAARTWSFAGYGPPHPLPGHAVDCLTPQLTLEALHGGYRPALHPSAA